MSRDAWIVGGLFVAAIVVALVVAEVQLRRDRRERRRRVWAQASVLDDVSLEEARRRLREPKSRISRRVW